MTHYASSVVVDPVATAPSVISQHPSQALVLANRPVQYPVSTAVTIPTGRNSYMYGSYPQPMYGYQQSVPVYVQPPQQQVMYSMPASYGVPSYGYGGMPMTSQYMPSTSVIVQDPYAYSSRRRHRHRRRHSYSGYPTYY